MYTWISEGDEYLSTSRYRAFAQHRRLIHHGTPACVWIGFNPKQWWVLNPHKTLWDDVVNNTCIIQRIPLTDHNKHEFKRISDLSSRYGYDLDDMIWDYRLLPINCDYTEKKCEGYAKAIDWAQFVTVSTPELKEELLKRWPNKTVYVVPNIIEAPLAYQSKFSRVQLRDSNRINLGYTSGTSMHQNDFKMILSVINQIMLSNPQVDLHIIGTLPIEDDFEHRWINQKRLFRWPFIKPDVLPLVIRSLFDINLIPLEDTRFNRCKSLAKYIEAGLFGVPSIGSRIGRFKALNADIALSASTQEEWTEYIQKLISNPQDRLRIGSAVREYVLEFRSVLTYFDLDGLLI